MASADWLKLTSPHAAGMGKHLDPEKRLASEHSNEDIDKSKSHLNITIGCETYGEALAAMRKRVKEVDKLYPPLKKKKADERVIAEMIEIKCPAEIAEQGVEAVYDYFRGIYKLEQEFFDAENVHGGFGHLDEIHEYTDKDGTKKTSLPHMHTLVTAYCEWEEPVKVKGKATGEKRERKGINGKNFEKKPRYNQLNKKIDEYCMEHYGITYTKGKGKEAGHGKSVEELKAEEKLHQIQAEQNKAQSDREAAERAAEQARQQREADEQQSAELQAAIDDQTAERDKLADEIADYKEGAAEAEAEHDRAIARVVQAVQIPDPPKPPFKSKPTPPITITRDEYIRNSVNRDLKWGERKKQEKEVGESYDKQLAEYAHNLAQWERWEQEKAEWQETYGLTSKVQAVSEQQAQTAKEQAAQAKALAEREADLKVDKAAVEQERATVAAERASMDAEIERRVQQALRKAQTFIEYGRTSARFNQLFKTFIGNGESYDEARQRREQEKAHKPKSIQKGYGDI